MADSHARPNSHAHKSPVALKPGNMLGRFELKRQLGQGAQSTVWLAFDPRMEREVAIKVLRPAAGTDDQSIRQWLQEARSVGRVKHPSIVPVFEADIHEQYTFLVFEYVAGDTLAQLLTRRGALPVREAVALMMDVLDAIAVAHAEGVIHRDLKPSNILVDGSGRARVMDFGIAARVRQASDVAVGGTVGYMSPEAMAGAAPAASMDLFACGLVMAELLMGKPLVQEADSQRAMYRVAHEQLALPDKLLRVVNSAHFARSGSINTVSRAVTLVGFNGIRNMALSLVLLEHMQDKTHAAQLKDEFVRCLLAGTLGGEMCAGSKEAEEAFIGAMFQNLGRLLTQFYFPEEAAQVRSLLLCEKPAMSETAASQRILGLSFERLGLGVAKAWGLPESIQKCMLGAHEGAPPGRPADDSERMRWVSSASNEIADVLLTHEAHAAQVQLALVARKYAQALGSSEGQVRAVVEQAKTKLCDMVTAMEIRLSPDSAAHKLLHMPAQAQQARLQEPGPGIDSQISSLALQATQAVPVGAAVSQVRSRQVAETLAAGIQDITNAMVEDFKLTDVLRMILETMFRAMDFDRIIFCMRDPKTELVTGRFGLGNGVEAYVKGFQVPLKAATPDLFAVDSMISDASELRIVSRLPTWYLRSLNAPAFLLLLPLHIKGTPFGLIYADKTRKGALELDDKELALLRTLRNQAVMAFKQSR